MSRISIATGKDNRSANRSALSKRAAQGNLSQFNSLDFLLPWFEARCSIQLSYGRVVGILPRTDLDRGNGRFYAARTHTRSLCVDSWKWNLELDRAEAAGRFYFVSAGVPQPVFEIGACVIGGIDYRDEDFAVGYFGVVQLLLPLRDLRRD